MSFFYFLDKYLDKLTDINFQVKWRKYFHDNLSRSISTLFFLWILIIIGVGVVFIKAVGLFFGLILMLFFSGYFAYILIFQFLRFLAKHNTRYVQSQIFNESNTINYEDVVETIKK